MIKRAIKKLATMIGYSTQRFDLPKNETELLAIGTMLSNQQYSMNSININDYEFKIFSQFGDDGIIQYLIKHIPIQNEIFIEFGVEDYLESTTRFLMMNNNWTGFVMDGSEDAMQSLENQSWYWRYSLSHKAIFITQENINELLANTGFSDIGLLHIDLDGNDYHILTELDLSTLNPSILILEYNSVFGKDRPITVPYDRDFIRTNAHYSNLYYGASLPALNYAASKKGYALIGCNRAGNNAYFVKTELLNERIRELPVKDAFTESKFRESRDQDYSLSYLVGQERYEMIKGLEVLNVVSDKLEYL
jgi:hypothetical protein